MRPPKQPPAPRGRPRQKPVGVRERGVWLTDDEAKQVARAAEAEGMSSAQWMRWAILRGAGWVEDTK
jgi:hypothetical protein